MSETAVTHWVHTGVTRSGLHGSVKAAAVEPPLGPRGRIRPWIQKEDKGSHSEVCGLGQGMGTGAALGRGSHRRFCPLQAWQWGHRGEAQGSDARNRVQPGHPTRQGTEITAQQKP